MSGLIVPARQIIPIPAIPTFVPKANSFVIVFLPDTHVVSGNVWEWQYIYKWVLANLSTFNIVALVGEGDIITDALDGTLGPAEFALAKVGWDAFTAASLPNVFGVGNHDYDADAGPSTRAITRFDTAFPLSGISGNAWYGGSEDGASAKNSYITFTVGTRKFLVLNLEIYPTTASLTWALGIANANLDHEVILMTHSYLNPDGTLTKSTDMFGSASGPADGNDAPAVWAQLGSQAANMKFIVSGHQYRFPTPTSNRSAYSPEVGVNGNTVHQWFCNYQFQNQGDGMIGLLRLYTTSSQVDLCAYSTLNGLPDPASIVSFLW